MSLYYIFIEYKKIYSKDNLQGILFCHTNETEDNESINQEVNQEVNQTPRNSPTNIGGSPIKSTFSQAIQSAAWLRTFYLNDSYTSVSNSYVCVYSFAISPVRAPSYFSKMTQQQ